jgi:phosphoadenosine phosphosulfate reductase
MRTEAKSRISRRKPSTAPATTRRTSLPTPPAPTNSPVIDAATLIQWALKLFHPRLALACSFSPEDIVVAHLMTSYQPGARVFALDTGRLHEETYECAEQVRRRMGIAIEWHFPDRRAVETLESEKGLYSFRESVEARRECCRIRKVEPLGRALAGLDAWLTGMRRAQSVTRTTLDPVERDQPHRGIVKINPLADWTEQMVWAYIEAHDLPWNALHERGFASIGCAPCTRAIRAGQDPRAGRWWWEEADKKECGLHTRGEHPKTV